MLHWYVLFLHRWNSGYNYSYLAQTCLQLGCVAGSLHVFSFVAAWVLIYFLLSSVVGDPVACQKKEYLFPSGNAGSLGCHKWCPPIRFADNVRNVVCRLQLVLADTPPSWNASQLMWSTQAIPNVVKLTLSLAPNSDGLFDLPRTMERTCGWWMLTMQRLHFLHFNGTSLLVARIRAGWPNTCAARNKPMESLCLVERPVALRYVESSFENIAIVY